MLRDINANGIVELLDLYRNPDFKAIFSAQFIKKSREEQEAIINRVRPFTEEKINIDKLIETSRDYYYPTVDFLVEQLEKHMDERIISKQDPDGGWLLVDWNYLKEIDNSKETLQRAEKYFYKYKDIYNKVYNKNVEKVDEILVPTYWSNYIVLLLLNKWKLCIQSNKHLSNYSLDKINTSIDTGAEWLKKNSLGEGAGWPRTHKDVSTNLNTYDTCMAIIAINYHMSFFKQDNIKEEFFGRKDLETLISEDVRNKNGSWRKEITSETEDIGATAYALQCLMKYYKRGDDNEFKKIIVPIIKDGVLWLMQNQFNAGQYEGGWGESNKLVSERATIERTCYALMALVKYKKLSNRNEDLLITLDPERPINKGIDFLIRQKNLYEEYPIGFIWPDDYGNGNRKTSLKNSSLVISTLVRCGIESHDLIMKQGLIGASRFYEKSYNNNSCNNAWYNPIYFFCMLADFLKFM